MNLFESIVIFTILMIVMRYSVCAYVETHCCFTPSKDK